MKQLHHILLLIAFIIGSLNCQILSAQAPQTNREFKDDFKSRYNNKTYNYEGKDVKSTSRLNDGKHSEYADRKPNIKEDNNQGDFSFGFTSFNWIFVIILVLAVGYLAYTLLNDGSNGLFSRNSQKKLHSHDSITAETIENTDIKSLITKAENSNDYRLAIRYYYLLVLKTLSLKNVIKFEDDKTNADYTIEIASKTYSNDFGYTSYLYNYIWYGEFPLNDMQYQKAKERFVSLLKSIN